VALLDTTARKKKASSFLLKVGRLRKLPGLSLENLAVMIAVVLYSVTLLGQSTYNFVQSQRADKRFAQFSVTFVLPARAQAASESKEERELAKNLYGKLHATAMDVLKGVTTVAVLPRSEEEYRSVADQFSVSSTESARFLASRLDPFRTTDGVRVKFAVQNVFTLEPGEHDVVVSTPFYILDWEKLDATVKVQRPPLVFQKEDVERISLLTIYDLVVFLFSQPQLAPLSDTDKEIIRRNLFAKFQNFHYMDAYAQRRGRADDLKSLFSCNDLNCITEKRLEAIAVAYATAEIRLRDPKGYLREKAEAKSATMLIDQTTNK